MARVGLSLVMLGIVLTPVGVFLATLRGCLQYVTVLGGQICVEEGIPYMAPGYALLVLGVLLFIIGLVMVIMERR